MNTKPNILLIYTGGTIGMVKNPDTGVLKAFNFDNLIKQIPELKLLSCNIATVSFEEPIDSSNMNPKEWVKIATLVEQNYHDFDGFVILHGSDTMSYTASALSFMFENLKKPVILTGSQLPIGDLRTDAKENLITSIQIAALQQNNQAVIQEVGLYFEYKLYRGNRTTKINAENFEAFASLNYPQLAESGVHLSVFHQNLLQQNTQILFSVHKKLNTNIALIKLFPGISPAVIHAVLNVENLQGVVIESYGSGNTTTQKWFVKSLRAAIQKGIVLINVTQCSGGKVIMGKYETSKHLQELGVISGKDITTEAALCKLMYLLGKETPLKQFKNIFETPLRGEMT